jgi:DNA-3-methyladenine glycosylase II
MPKKTIPSATAFECVIALPKGFRFHDILRFHARDSTALSEEVSEKRLRKAVVLHGTPCQISIEFFSDHANLQLLSDAHTPFTETDLIGIGQRLLGLHFDTKKFEKKYAKDPHLGTLVQRQTGLTIAMVPTVFEALVWAITGQQITVSFAIQLRRRLIALTNIRHSQGLVCHPDAQAVAKLDAEQLGELKFSRAKSATILRIAQMVQSGELRLESTTSNGGAPASAQDYAALSQQLLAIKGVGPWTVNYAMMRGAGYADCSLHGDVVVRSALQNLIGAQEKISEAEAKAWLENYAPWRSLVAAHLWASKTLQA